MEAIVQFQDPAVLPPEYNFSTNWIGGWMRPWADLGGFGEENVLACTEHQTSQPVSGRTDYTIPALEILIKIMNVSATILFFGHGFAAGTSTWLHCPVCFSVLSRRLGMSWQRSVGVPNYTAIARSINWLLRSIFTSSKAGLFSYLCHLFITSGLSRISYIVIII
jgi:hypothetical protein